MWIFSTVLHQPLHQFSVCFPGPSIAKSSPPPFPETSYTWLPYPKWLGSCKDGWCVPSPPSLPPSKFRAPANAHQLSKEDEAAGEEVEVRREDQDKINKFSRLSTREQILEEELKGKAVRVHLHTPPLPNSPSCVPRANTASPSQKEKEELDDVSGELELADEDETVPYA